MHLEKELTKYDEPGSAQCQGQDMKEVYAELSKMNWFIAYGVLSENEQRTLKKGVLLRVHAGAYSEIKRVRMRQKIGRVSVSAGLSWRLLAAKRRQRR